MSKRKENSCFHNWEIIEKWHESNEKISLMFYCRNCLAVRVVSFEPSKLEKIEDGPVDFYE